MAHLSLDQARVGMVLAADVKDRRGRLLVPAGRELSERHLEALRMWGVPAVEIDGDDGEGDDVAPIDPEIEARARADVDDLFVHAAEAHPFVDVLRKLAVERQARALAREVAV